MTKLNQNDYQYSGGLSGGGRWLAGAGNDEVNGGWKRPAKMFDWGWGERVVVGVEWGWGEGGDGDGMKGVVVMVGGRGWW